MNQAIAWHAIWLEWDQLLHTVMAPVLNVELIPIFDLYIPITFLINTAIQYDTNNTYYNYIIMKSLKGFKQWFPNFLA